jgi:hypothetical protein
MNHDGLARLCVMVVHLYLELRRKAPHNEGVCGLRFYVDRHNWVHSNGAGNLE